VGALLHSSAPALALRFARSPPPPPPHQQAQQTTKMQCLSLCSVCDAAAGPHQRWVPVVVKVLPRQHVARLVGEEVGGQAGGVVGGILLLLGAAGGGGGERRGRGGA
jgi:hypothetical protein